MVSLFDSNGQDALNLDDFTAQHGIDRVGP